jgi:hypothetical protein
MTGNYLSGTVDQHWIGKTEGTNAIRNQAKLLLGMGPCITWRWAQRIDTNQLWLRKLYCGYVRLCMHENSP